MLQLEEIEGGYIPGSLVLQGINLTVGSGEVVGIIGLNGCGKSTLGKAVMNMIPFRTGKVLVNGNDVSNRQSSLLHGTGIGMVMQGGRIFPQMTTREHLQFAGNMKSENELKNRVKEIEERLGLFIFTSGIALNRKASYLSGGEKQQLVLMMALLNNPVLLILDEISAGLSPANVEMVAGVIEKLKAGKNVSILLIEQNIRLAARLSDRLLLLERGIIDKEFIIDNNFDITKLNENIFN